MSDPDPDFYDLRGLKCPLPVLKTKKRLTSLPSGAQLTIRTSDPLAVIDIPHFCNQEGHELMGSSAVEGGGHMFVIRKR